MDQLGDTTDLTTEELRILFGLIEACHDVECRDDFLEWVYPSFRKLISHSHFACGIGSTPENYVLCHLNVNFPEAYLRRVISKDGRLTSPVARWWVQSKVPQYVDLERLDGTDDGVPKAWVKAAQEHGFRNLVGHGMADIKSKAASYFALANVDRWGDREAALLEIMVPHLHLALVNLATELPRTEPIRLSPREREVLAWIKEGKSNDEIGIILGISSGTVKVHVKNILQKLEVSTRTQAVAKALEHGLV